MDNCTIARAMESSASAGPGGAARGLQRGAAFRRHAGADAHPPAGPVQPAGHARRRGRAAAGAVPRAGCADPHEYRLTQKGLDLWPVLVALLDWGNRYLVDADGPPMHAVHRDCGGEVHAVLHCDAGHEITTRAPSSPAPAPAPAAVPRHPQR